MSHGFLAVNNNNQVLVSSDTRNLHFLEKLNSPTITNSTDYYGGLREFKYTISCAVTPVPFFTMPTGDYYGITGIRSPSPGTWEIEMIKSGTNNTFPDVYVFADPRASTATDTHGMVVYRDDGTPAFDSRLRPLVVTSGAAVTHPSNPRPSFPYSLSSDYCNSAGSSAGGHFAPDQFKRYLVPITSSKPMFHYSSLAQAQRQANYRRTRRECIGFNAYGACVGYGTEEVWESRYWCFYRGGIRRGSTISDTYVDAGWIAVYWGCNWVYSKDKELFGIDIGGKGGEGGSWPYTNETINLSSTSVIIADATRYD